MTREEKVIGVKMAVGSFVHLTEALKQFNVATDFNIPMTNEKGEILSVVRIFEWTEDGKVKHRIQLEF